MNLRNQSIHVRTKSLTYRGIGVINDIMTAYSFIWLLEVKYSVKGRMNLTGRSTKFRNPLSNRTWWEEANRPNAATKCNQGISTLSGSKYKKAKTSNGMAKYAQRNWGLAKFYFQNSRNCSGLRKNNSCKMYHEQQQLRLRILFVCAICLRDGNGSLRTWKASKIIIISSLLLCISEGITVLSVCPGPLLGSFNFWVCFFNLGDLDLTKSWPDQEFHALNFKNVREVRWFEWTEGHDLFLGCSLRAKPGPIDF